MLGSVHDADDALQDALLRAWRGLAKFEGRSSVRSWLYRITTNTCLDLISRRPKRVLPIDHGPAADLGNDLGEPLIESVWAEDATFTMPPLPTWYRGHNAIALFLTRFALRDRWRLVPARAKGQLAFGCYAWDAETRSHTALSLDVLTLEGTRATEVTSFVTPYTRGPARERFAADVFERFGLPDRLD